jgi:hypothetical protein
MIGNLSKTYANMKQRVIVIDEMWRRRQKKNKKPTKRTQRQWKSIDKNRKMIEGDASTVGRSDILLGTV